MSLYWEKEKDPVESELPKLSSELRNDLSTDETTSNMHTLLVHESCEKLLIESTELILLKCRKKRRGRLQIDPSIRSHRFRQGELNGNV